MQTNVKKKKNKKRKERRRKRLRISAQDGWLTLQSLRTLFSTVIKKRLETWKSLENHLRYVFGLYWNAFISIALEDQVCCGRWPFFMARSVTNWNSAIDKRPARLICYIHPTTDYTQCCHVGNEAVGCKLGFVPRYVFRRKLGGPKVHVRMRIVRIRKLHNCSHIMMVAWIIWTQAYAWRRKTRVEPMVHCHRSDTPKSSRQIRMSSPDGSKGGVARNSRTFWKHWLCVTKRITIQHEIVAKPFWQQRSRNQMIDKGRNPTMRHVSMTHRVDLNWLYDWINLDPAISVKSVDNAPQFADTVSKEAIRIDG